MTTTPTTTPTARSWHWPWRRTRPVELHEQKGHLSAIALLLMVTQSVALAFVAGHMEIAWLFGQQQMMRLLAIASLFILVAAVIAADSSALKTMQRIPTLLRNHAGGLFWEHVAYAGFVIVVEAATYGICLWTLDQNPAALLSSQPLMPQSIWFAATVIVARVVMVAWTYVQSQIIAQPLAPQWETGLARSIALIGGHAARLLEQVQLTNTDIGSVFEAFATVTRPAPRKPRLWNRRAIERDAAFQRQLDLQRDQVVKALRQLSEDKQREDDDQIAALTAMQDQVTRNMSALQDRVVEELFALRDLVESGVKPSANRGQKKRQSRRDLDEQFLEELDVAPAKAPAKLDAAGEETGERERGLWIRSTDMGRLIQGQMSPEALRELVKRVGDGRKDGTTYVARFDRLMAELATRNWLNDEARMFWETRVHARQNVASLLGTTERASAGVEPADDGDTDQDASVILPLTRRANAG